MKQFFLKPYRFVIFFTAALVLFSVYVVLDTFVIPHGYMAVPPSGEENGASVSSQNPQTTLGSSDGASEDRADSDSNSDSSSITEPLITDRSYRDENISITVTTVREKNTDVHVAEVMLSSPEYLYTAFAKDTYGRNIKETTSSIAERVGAILAVNGDFYGFRDKGYVIRNGVLFRKSVYSSSREVLVINGNGEMYGVREREVSAEELLLAGAEQVLSFGPILVQDSEVVVDRGDEIGNWNSNPRCAVGMVEPLHYIFVVSDGRTSRSEGLLLEDLAEVMLEWGCTFAYNLDGGGSATMVFNGEVINYPTDGNSAGERKVSDVVCIGY